MKKYNALFLCFLLCISYSWGQKLGQERIDSLLAILPNAPEDTSRVKILIDLSYYHAFTNPDAGIKYGMEGMALSKKLSWTPGFAKCNSVVGSNYANKSDYANALKYEYVALQLYEKLNDLPNQAILLRNLGVVYHRAKNQQKALEYYNKSMQLYNSSGNMEGVAAIYSNMANAYYTLRQMDKVIESNLKSLELYRKINNREGEARLLGNIGNYYAETGDFNQAMVYYFDALQKEESIGNKNGAIRNMGNIGQTYFDISNLPAGSIKPDKLIPAGKSANLKKALEYLEATVAGAKEMQQAEYQLAFQEILSDVYHMTGNTTKALNTYKEYIAIRDSVYDVEKYNEATRRELDYEYGKREDSINFEKRISEVKLQDEKKLRSREKFFFTSGILLVMIFSVFMYNRWRITRRQKVVIEKEKKRSDELLLNILPEETAEELKATGTTKAKHFEEVTVLFTDFKNFTVMSERLTAQELVNEINYCYSAFDTIITKYDIEKIKTIGDSYMCAAGLPTESKTHAMDAVRAALEIREFIENEKSKRLHAGLPYFEIRIGLNSGPVVAGIVGLKKFAYDIWGDTVNIASRMESSGEPGKVNISGATYELVKNDFACTHRGKIEAKNKGEVDMYFAEKK